MADNTHIQTFRSRRYDLAVNTISEQDIAALIVPRISKRFNAQRWENHSHRGIW